MDGIPSDSSRAANAGQDVLVIGAGPAGMECAIVLVKARDEPCAPVDAAPEIGGSMRWIPKLPGLGEWGRVVD